MIPDVREITLGTLANGAIEEMFGEALLAILTNVDDVNTDHKAKRSIMMTFAFSVDEDRHVGHVDVQVQTKLAGVKGVTANVYFGRHEGRHVAVEAPSQETLFPAPESRPRSIADAADGGKGGA